MLIVPLKYYLHTIFLSIIVYSTKNRTLLMNKKKHAKHGNTRALKVGLTHEVFETQGGRKARERMRHENT